MNLPMALAMQKTPTRGKDILPNMRVPHKILKKMIKLFKKIVKSQAFKKKNNTFYDSSLCSFSFSSLIDLLLIQGCQMTVTTLFRFTGLEQVKGCV